MPLKCKICGIRKPRRYCPGVSGDICSICCGTEREVTVACPLDCPYLIEARIHEKPPEIDPAKLPNPDVEITSVYLSKHRVLTVLFGVRLVRAALDTAGAVDSDVAEALDSLARTYRTLSSGLYYDSQPVNPFASAIYARLREAMNAHEESSRERGATVRDAELLGAVVLFQRLGLRHYNGRPKGRAYIGFLLAELSQEMPEVAEPSSPLIEL